MAAVDKGLTDALQRCNKCGFCLSHCPIYKVTGIEWTAARGRIALIMNSLLDGRIKLDDIREPVYNCLTCNACLEDCPAGVTTADIIFKTREELLKRQGQSWIQKLLLHKVLTKPSMVHAASKLLRLADVTNSRILARKVGLTRLMGDTGRAEAIVPRVPTSGGLVAINRLAGMVEHFKYRVAYFTGCYAPNLAPERAAATIRILHRHKVEVVVPEFVCCGLPASGCGDMASAQSLARTNIDIAGKLKVDAIVTPCASCSSFLKDYGKLLTNDLQWSERATNFCAGVKDLSEFLVDVGLITDMSTIRKKITFHDPCHLAHHQKITEQPRTILKSIPGVNFVEMGEANMCCGAAGNYAFKNYDLSMKVLDRKINNVDKTAADILVSSCPACIMQLSYGVSQHMMPIRVLEIVELLDYAYQGNLED